MRPLSADRFGKPEGAPCPSASKWRFVRRNGRGKAPAEGEMGRGPSGIGHFLSPGEAGEIMVGPLQSSLDSKARPYTDKN